MRVADVPAWVLHRRSYRESSFLVELISAEHGRVAVVARAQKKAAGTSLQPFRRLRASWSRRGELGTLGAVETVGPPLALAGESLWCGLYVNELTMRLSFRDDPNPALMDVYERALQALGQGHDREVLRHFEWQLLDAIGYGFDPTLTASELPIEAEGQYRWQPGQGIVAAGEGQGVPGGSLLALAAGPGAGSVAAARGLLAAALDEHLEGRPLRSSQMLRQMDRMLRERDHADAGKRRHRTEQLQTGEAFTEPPPGQQQDESGG